MSYSASTESEIDSAISNSISEIHVYGDISQKVSKAINAWHKFRGFQHKTAAAGATAVGAICFGPVGWVVGLGATGGILLLKKQKEEAERAYRAVPYAELGQRIARAKYFVYTNDGSSLVLKKE